MPNQTVCFEFLLHVELLLSIDLPEPPIQKGHMFDLSRVMIDRLFDPSRLILTPSVKVSCIIARSRHQK